MCKTKVSYIVRQKEEILQNFVRRDNHYVRQAPNRDIALSYYYQKVSDEMSNDPNVIQWEITGSFYHLFIENFKTQIGLHEDISKALLLVKEDTQKRFDESLVKEQIELFSISDQELIDRLIKTLAYEEYLERFYQIHEQEELKGLDDRIKGNCNKEEIMSYFTQLVKLNNGKQVLTPEQVEHFLHANFAEFHPKKKRKKFHTPDISQAKLRRFVYQFYVKDNRNRRTDEYVALLIDNFHAFDNTSLESLKSNFSK
jgi:hypothetical protein